MSINKSLIALLGFLATGWLATANAAITAHNCNACAGTQYRQMALQYAPAAYSTGSAVYIYDFTNVAFKKFQVGREPGFNGQFTYIVNALTPTMAEQESFDLGQDAWSNTGHTMRRAVVIIPGSPPGTGFPAFPPQVSTFVQNDGAGFYGIARTSAMQNYLSSYADAWMHKLTGLPAGDSYVSLWQTLNGFATLLWEGQNPFSLTVEINMPGGGKITLQLQTGDNGPTWKVVKMVDRNNNTVPLDPGQVSNGGGTTNYLFSEFHEDIGLFEWYLSNNLNIPVTHGANGGWKIACTVVPGSGSGQRCVAVF